MRRISLFVYKDENEHIRTRQEIENYLYVIYRNFENISIPPEDEAKSIFEYIIGLEYLENGMAT